MPFARRKKVSYTRKFTKGHFTTEKEYKLTTLEINFYEIDSLINMPSKKLNNADITYTPKNKARGTVTSDIQKHAIPFPKGGFLAAVKGLPTPNQNKNAGPALRQTNYKERITCIRYKEGKWFVHGRYGEKRGILCKCDAGSGGLFPEKERRIVRQQI